MKGKLAIGFIVIVTVAVVAGIMAYGLIAKSQPPRTPSASFSVAEQDSASTMKLTFGDADSSIKYVHLKIILHINDTVSDVYLGRYAFDPNNTSYTNPVTDGRNYSVSYDDLDSDGLVDPGESVGVAYSGSELPSGVYTVYLIWIGNGDAITIVYVPI